MLHAPAAEHVALELIPSSVAGDLPASHARFRMHNNTGHEVTLLVDRAFPGLVPYRRIYISDEGRVHEEGRTAIDNLAWRVERMAPGHAAEIHAPLDQGPWSRIGFPVRVGEESRVVWYSFSD